MTRVIRNFLVTFGAFWLSLWTVSLFSWLFGKLNEHFIYSDNVFSMVMMGVMMSMGRAVSAILAAAIVVVSADSEKPERWAYIIAVLYVVDAPVRYGRWYVSPTVLDRLSRGVDRLFPAIACIIGAVVIAHFQRKKATFR